MAAHRAYCSEVFEQPVLETLLLSAVDHPEPDLPPAQGHRRALWHHGNLTPCAALAGAIVTAEVFLKLVPLLDVRLSAS